MAGIDWLAEMRQHAANSPEIFIDRLDENWIVTECEIAQKIAFRECPDAQYQYENGDLDDGILAYVVCQMVLRVARWTLRKTESNGQSTYTLDSPARLPSGVEMSPNLWVTNRERELLEGKSDRGPIGTIWAGSPWS